MALPLEGLLKPVNGREPTVKRAKRGLRGEAPAAYAAGGGAEPHSIDKDVSDDYMEVLRA